MRSLGVREVLIQMTATVTKAFKDYFSPEQRMDESMHASFAETIIEDFPHESPADIALFIKHAARGKYGEIKYVRDNDGYVVRREVINHGKTYGRLTTTLAVEWFRQYLEEKAEAIENDRMATNARLNEHVQRNPDSTASPVIHDTIVELVRKVRAEREPDPPDLIKNMRKLKKFAPHMTDDQLREAYQKHRNPQERSVILAEANKRGLVQRRIEQHLKGDGEA